MKHGKKYVDSAKLIDRAKLYDTTEALELCVKTGSAKFDESVEVHVKLGVDSRHADQQVRGAIVLPNGTGKSVRVVAICKGDNEKAAQAAGAGSLTGTVMPSLTSSLNSFAALNGTLDGTLTSLSGTLDQADGLFDQLRNGQARLFERWPAAADTSGLQPPERRK